jgi:hypothetical protein
VPIGDNLQPVSEDDVILSSGPYFVFKHTILAGPLKPIDEWLQECKEASADGSDPTFAEPN